MLQYITLSNTWGNLSLGDYITFNIPNDSDCIYVIDQIGSTRYFCTNTKDIRGLQNRLIFDKLGIDAEKFIADIVGYTCIGQWPEVKTIDDLKKVIKALDDECIKKWGMPNQNVSPYNLKNGDYIKIISTKSNISFIYLFKEMQSNRIWRHASYDLKCRISSVYPHYCLFNDNTKITYATEEERKLLDNALLEQGFKWNNLTKQLESIGIVDIKPKDFNVSSIDSLHLDTSCIKSQIQRLNDMLMDSPNYRKRETQTETELNLFPKKKHYQLNFNY